MNALYQNTTVVTMLLLVTKRSNGIPWEQETVPLANLPLVLIPLGMTTQCIWKYGALF
jgi:hypothetical protein